MGSLPSTCGGDSVGVNTQAQSHHRHHNRPQGHIRHRESNDVLAGRPPPPPYSRTEPSTNRGYDAATYGNYRGNDPYYPPQPSRGPGFKPNEPPPPYSSPLRSSNDDANVHWPSLSAVHARPSVVTDPGDLWMYSEQPPSPVSDDGDVDLDSGDDVVDFETHPDGHLVFISDKDYETRVNNLMSMNSDGLFEDPDFPAEPESIFADGSRDASDIEWRRPNELCSNPRLVVDGFSRQDVVQGNLGDCWFLAPLSAIAKMPTLIERIVPEGQSFTTGYTGMFRFRFWRFGRWVTVVIDDRLPVSHGVRPMFATSSDDDEFWPSLVEKAYAKLHGSYSGLSGGMAADAFVDLTGGMAEVYDLTTENPDDIYGILYRGTRSGAFMCCSRKYDFTFNTVLETGCNGHHRKKIKIQQSMEITSLSMSENTYAAVIVKPAEGPRYKMHVVGNRRITIDHRNNQGNWRANETNNLGIVTGHSYTINKVQTGVLQDGSRVRLIQLRNPWANRTEWRGNWSDVSELWDNLKNLPEFEEDKERSVGDGEFWMSYKDFLAEFTKVVISTVGPDFDGDGIPDVVSNTVRGFHLVTRTGAWRAGYNAGGCPNYLLEGYCTNPQIIISLLEPDDWYPDKGMPASNRGKCVLIVTLLQEYRQIRNRKRTKKQSIGFRIFKTNSMDCALTRDDIMYMQSIGGSSDYINHREVFGRLVLEPGHYCVIPSTFEPNISLRFMTRIFTEKPIHCRVLQNER